MVLLTASENGENEPLRFYKLPKFLFEREPYKMLSVSAKVLYSILLDRLQLSVQNGYILDDGTPYVLVESSYLENLLSCHRNSINKYFAELEVAELIRKNILPRSSVVQIFFFQLCFNHD